MGKERLLWNIIISCSIECKRVSWKNPQLGYSSAVQTIHHSCGPRFLQPQASRYPSPEQGVVLYPAVVEDILVAPSNVR